MERKLLTTLLKGVDALGDTREEIIRSVKTNPNARNNLIKSFRNLLKEHIKQDFKSFGEFQLKLFKSYLSYYGIKTGFGDRLKAIAGFKFLFQNFFLWLGEDITKELFKVQKIKGLTYTEEEKNEILNFYLNILLEVLANANYKSKEVEKCREKIIEQAKRIDDGLWELRAIVYAVGDKVMQIYLFNEEFFEVKKPLVSVADVLTLDEKQLKEKIELAKLMGKEYSDEIVDYGIGTNLNEGFLGYCEKEIGAMAIPYINLPFVVLPIFSFYFP